MGKILILLAILYVLSPSDAWPGIIDDLLVLGISIVCSARLQASAGSDDDDRNDSDDSDDSDD